VRSSTIDLAEPSEPIADKISWRQPAQLRLHSRSR
jgi:hypothetical protein